MKNSITYIIGILIFFVCFIGCQKEDIFIVSKPSPTPVSNDSSSLKRDSTAKDTVVSVPEVPATPVPTPTVTKADYYVSPSGNDNNAGTYDKPFATIQKAYRLASGGKLIYVRGGSYTLNSMINLTGQNGTSGNMIKIWAYPGEKPVFDLSDLTSDHGIYMGGSYIHLMGLELKNLRQPENGQYISTVYIDNGNHNIVEQLNIHHNGGAGVYLDKSSSQNIILNCDLHHNYDPYTPGYRGGNADGLHACTYEGSTNYIKGCRIWNNSDDGIDCFCAAGTIVITNTWCFRNGFLDGTNDPTGDGNGFKLGGDGDAGNSGYARQLMDCLSFENFSRGYNDNNSNDKFDIEFSIAYNNGAEGFNLNNSDFDHILTGNISFGNQMASADINSQSIQKHNNWNDRISPSSADFYSLDSGHVLDARQSDGSLPRLDFLKVKSESALYQYCVDPTTK